MVNPDFVGIGKAYGIEGNKVTDRENLQEAIQAMLDHEGPYLLEIVVEKEDNVFPMVPAGDSVANIRLEA
jgi:acetolactate synthase-1/2/3 large subunit